jgi:aspartyl-tRNA(Asn)/glutamyl-tRNA(Gln) amidotransferase subunit C
MGIDRSDIEKVAELARLRLDEDELDGLTWDCQSILEFFEAIRGVDVESAEPAGALEHAAPTREDSVDHDQLTKPLDRMAPAWRECYFVLPRLPALDADDLGGDEG